MTRMSRPASALVRAVAITAAACALPGLHPTGGMADPVLAAEPGSPAPGEADPGAVREGRSIFNQTCAHCHGPDAITGQPERNLRHLRLRYGDDMWKVFHSTVVQGRPDKGMPVWGEILDEPTIERIYGYLNSVQSRDE